MSTPPPTLSTEAPEDGLERLARRAVAPTGWLLLACAIVWGLLVVQAPEDAVQGIVQKILYVHPPCAFAAYLGFFLTALGGAVYLARRDPAWDRFAISAAEVGVLFCALLLATGPIWGKGTWGRWWTWDLRLTLSLLLFLVYVAYLLLRSFTEGDERTARFAAVYGIAGLAVIPLNYFAIDLAGGRALHPENLGGDSLGEGMGWPFLAGVVTCLVAFGHLFARRLEVAGLRDRRAREAAEAAAAAGEPAWDT